MKNKRFKKLISDLLKISFKDGKIIEYQVIRSIKALKSLPKYQAIETISEYVKRLKRLQSRHTMYIETVIPLNKVQLQKIKKNVEKKAMPDGRQAKITKVVTQINPSILGGFILKVGDEVWDESILDRVNQVKEVIIHGGSD